MRRFAFIVMVIGMIFLVFFLSFPVSEVSNNSDLESLEENAKVQVSGRVVSEENFYGREIIVLDNGIELVCDCGENFDGKNVEVIGIVEDYNGRKRVSVSQISLRL